MGFDADVRTGVVLVDANVAEAGEQISAPSSAELHRSLFRRVRDHLTLLAGIRFCAVFNAGALIALVGYGAIMVGLDRLGVSIVIFIPMVATFLFGLLLSGMATTSWFASRHHMEHVGALAESAPGIDTTAPQAAMKRAARFQSLTTNFVAASYVTFIAGLAGLPMFLSGFDR